MSAHDFWSPASCRESGYADAVYQRQLQTQLEEIEQEVGPTTKDSDVLVHGSDFEEELFLQNEEKEAGEASFGSKQLDEARLAYQTIRLKDKAEKALGQS